MSTAPSQTVLTVVKDEFTEVLTKGTLSPATKPTDWNVIITEKTLLEDTRTVKQKRRPDQGLNPGPSRHIPDALNH
jgi:hypothetical protein